MNRLFGESIKLAAEEGAETVLIPYPRTLSLIEAYFRPEVESSGTRDTPYTSPNDDDRDLSVGDEIVYEGESYRVLEADSTDITVARSRNIFQSNLSDAIYEQAWNDVSELKYELKQAILREGFSFDPEYITQEQIDAIREHDFSDSNLIDVMDRQLRRAIRDAGDTLEDAEPYMPYIEWSDFEERLAQDRMEDLWNWDPSDILGGQAYLDGDYAWVVEYGEEILNFKQPDQYDELETEDDVEALDEAEARDSDFNKDYKSIITDEEHQTVVYKYIELNKDFKKLRPDAKPYLDKNKNLWLETKITEEDRNNPVIAFQKEGEKAKAAIDFMNEGRATVHIFKGADISSLAHEMTGHIGRRVLERLAAQNEDFAKDYEAAKKWAGVKGDYWHTAAEEKFARGFERYLRSGKAPSKSLQSVFNKLREWLSNIYKQIKGGSIDVNITPRMKKVFDNLLAYKPEPKVEAEKTKPKTKEAKVETKPRKDILDKAKKLADLYREIKSGNVSVRPELDDLLEQNPKLKYLYKNLPSINAKLEKEGLITKKTDGCP